MDDRRKNNFRSHFITLIILYCNNNYYDGARAISYNIGRVCEVWSEVKKTTDTRINFKEIDRKTIVYGIIIRLSYFVEIENLHFACRTNASDKRTEKVIISRLVNLNYLLGRYSRSTIDD